MDPGLWYHVVTVFSLIFFKLAVLFVGYLIAKLGYELLVKGVTGEFRFQAEIKDTKADLISASPGLFFILMATILIAIGVLKDKPFETRIGIRTIASGAEQSTSKNPGDMEKPILPNPTQ